MLRFSFASTTGTFSMLYSNSESKSIHLGAVVKSTAVEAKEIRSNGVPPPLLNCSSYDSMAHIAIQLV